MAVFMIVISVIVAVVMVVISVVVAVLMIMVSLIVAVLMVTVVVAMLMIMVSVVVAVLMIMFSVIVAVLMVMIFVIVAMLMIMPLMAMGTAAHRADILFLLASLFHGFQDLASFQLLNGGGNDHRILVHAADQLHRLLHFFICGFRSIRAAQNNRLRVLQLIFKKFAEVSHVHFAFIHIHHCGIAVQADLTVGFHILYRLDNVRQLSHTGGLNHNPVRMIRVDHFF